MARYTWDHVHVIANDPKKTIEWYERAFNAETLLSGQFPDGSPRIWLRIGGQKLLIMTARGKSRSKDDPQNRYGLEHFGLEVDDIEAAVAELKKKGIEPTEDIRKGDKGHKVTFLMAPDNVRIELLQNP